MKLPDMLHPFLAWTRLSLKTGEMLLASAQVISHRSARIAAAGPLPNARDRREFTLMGQEKIEAVAESMFAAATRMMLSNQQFGTMIWKQMIQSGTGTSFLSLRPLTGRRQADLLRAAMWNSAFAAKLGSAGAQLALQCLQPIHGRATRNAKRLSRQW